MGRDPPRYPVLGVQDYKKVKFPCTVTNGTKILSRKDRHKQSHDSQRIYSYQFHCYFIIKVFFIFESAYNPEGPVTEGMFIAICRHF